MALNPYDEHHPIGPGTHPNSPDEWTRQGFTVFDRVKAASGAVSIRVLSSGKLVIHRWVGPEAARLGP